MRPIYGINHTEQIVADALFGVLCIAALSGCIKVARAERRAWPLFLFLGACLVVVYEPFDNLLGHATWPDKGQFTVFTLFGRHMPLGVCLVYAAYYSVPILGVMHLIGRGITRRRWWQYYAAMVVGLWVFEIVPLALHWWRYYGTDQPIVLLGMPMFWAFANAMSILTIGALVHLLLRRDVLTDRSSWLLVPLMPMAMLALHGSACFPVYAAIQSGSKLAVTLASLGTIALSCLLVWLFGKIVTAPVTRPVVRPAVHGNDLEARAWAPGETVSPT